MKKSRSINSRLLMGVAGGVGLTAVSVGVSLLQFKILLRYLPLASAGLWMIFLNLGNYVLLLDLGLSPTFGREISFAAGDPDLSEAAKRQQIATLIRSCTFAVSGLAALIATVGSFAGWRYLLTFVPSAMEIELRRAWFLFAVGAALNLVGEGWFAGIYGLGHVFEEKLVRSSGALLGFLFFTAALLSGGGFLGLAAAFVLQAACTLLMARFMLHRLLENSSAEGRLDFRALARLLGPSFKYAATVLGGVLILQTDNLVIASIFGPSNVPNYQAVAKIVTILMSLSMMLITTSSPILSQAYAMGDMATILQLLNRNLRFSLAIMVILGSFIACFTDRLITVWIGSGHFVGFPVVWVLLAVMLLEAHHLSMASATMATGRVVFLVPALVAGGLNLLFSITLAHRIGLLGVACGTMAAQLLTNNWYVPWYTMRLFRISFARHLRDVLLPVGGLIALMLLAGYAVRSVTGAMAPFPGLVIGGASTILLGVTSASLLLLNQEERRFLLKRLAGLGVRPKALLSSIIE